MKFIFILLLICTMQTFATDILSQQPGVKLAHEETSLQQVLDELEKQTNLRFLYHNETVKNKTIKIDVKEKSWYEILEQIKEASDVNYRILEDNLIVLTPVKKLQPITITGTITDENGEPLPGVAIIVQGTTRGTFSDADGQYTIEVEDQASVLVFSFVGFAAQEVMVGDQTVINISMELEVIGLGDIVVIGYGTRRAGEITGSISATTSADIADMTVIDASEILKGTVSGLTITQSHMPGGGANIRVRGPGTINDNDPLWVVDGVPGGHVNPNNIESISILKDAAAQAIYGARGSNGVILVTTKSGRKGQDTQINASVKLGITQNISRYDLLNTQEYGELLWLEAKNADVEDFSHPIFGSGATPDIPEYIFPERATTVDYSLYDNLMIHEDGTDTYIIMKANKEGTDWQKEIYQNALYQEYNVDMSGGSETSNYAVQFGYLDEQGIIKYTGVERYNIGAHVINNPKKWLEIGSSIRVTYNDSYGRQSDNAESSPISLAYRIQPIIPVYDVMGNFAGSRFISGGNARNPLFMQHSHQHDRARALISDGNVYAEADIIKGLSIRSLFGFRYNTLDTRTISLVERAFSERGQFDQLSERSDFGFQWNSSNTLHYSNTFSNVHSINLVAGVEAIHNNARWRGESRENFFFSDPIYIQLDAGIQNPTNYGNFYEWSLFSIFGRANYVFNNKYLLEAVIRRDGSSRFGEENRYGLFPAFSAGWRVSNEDFMRATNNWLDFLMLRLGYGKTGNDRIGNYNAYTIFESAIGNSYYPIAGQEVGVGTPGFYRASIGEPGVRWETTSTYNLGVDANIFQNWNIKIDLWRRNTEDMLYPKRLPAVTGMASAPSINIGKMFNKGIDVEFEYSGSALNQELMYGASLYVSRYRNEIVQLSDVAGEFMEGQEIRYMRYTRAENGTAFPVFYGYEIEGIFQTEEEVANHPPAFGDYNEVGLFKFKDVNGDGVIDTDDRTILGDPHPDFTAGLNLNLSYRGFSISTRLYSSYGNDMVNVVRRYIDFRQFIANRSTRRLYESWGSPYLDDNKNAKMPKARLTDDIDQEPSSYYVEDASYLRMQNLQVSYNLSNLLPGLNIRQFQIYGQVTNVFTLTNYSGLDPEINAQGINLGVDRGGWPTPRRFMFGINIGI